MSTIRPDWLNSPPASWKKNSIPGNRPRAPIRKEKVFQPSIFFRCEVLLGLQGRVASLWRKWIIFQLSIFRGNFTASFREADPLPENSLFGPLWKGNSSSKHLHFWGFQFSFQECSPLPGFVYCNSVKGCMFFMCNADRPSEWGWQRSTIGSNQRSVAHLGTKNATSSSKGQFRWYAKHPIIYRVTCTSKPWLALGFLNHQQYGLVRIMISTQQKCHFCQIVRIYCVELIFKNCRCTTPSVHRREVSKKTNAKLNELNRPLKKLVENL